MTNLLKFIKRNDDKRGQQQQSQQCQQVNDSDSELKPPPTNLTKSSSSPFRRPLTFRAFITPTYPVAKSPGHVHSIKNAICYSWLNVLLLSAPISWALHEAHISDIGTFVSSIIGVIPLAGLLSFGTEEIALRTSVPLGGLLNATLGNLVEIIIAVLALIRCELSIVQSSLLGGLLSNILLVLGMSFLAGGFKYSSQSFKLLPASLNTSLLFLSVLSLMIPLSFHTILGDKFPENPMIEKTFILQMSRGTSIILIFIYLCYMTFTFYTHQEEFLDTIDNDESNYNHDQPKTYASDFNLNEHSSANFDLEAGFSGRRLTRSKTAPIMTPQSTDSDSTKCEDKAQNKFGDRKIEEPKLNIFISISILIITTILLYFTCEALVDSIQGLANSTSASKEWISLIVLPIVGNAAEHATAVIAAAKGKQELALSVALGSTVQIAIFVIPLVVLIAWMISKPLTLLFEPMETITLFLSVILARFAIDDGRSHWLSGCVLCGSYLIIALVFWYFPKSDTFELIKCVT